MEVKDIPRKIRNRIDTFNYCIRHGLKPIPNHPNIYISHKYKFISFQILKVASSVQYKLMYDLHEDYDLHENPENSQNTKELTIVNRPLYALYPSRYKYDDYYKWGFVRNPWDRLFSAYSNKIHDSIWKFNDPPFPMARIKNLRRKYHRIHQFGSITFEGFIKSVYKIPDFLCDSHFLPQHYYFNPQEMDFIGHFENFEADMMKLLSIVAPDCGIANFEKIRASSNPGGKAYREHYTDEMREMVARKYARDIELFDYQF